MHSGQGGRFWQFSSECFECSFDLNMQEDLRIRDVRR